MGTKSGINQAGTLNTHTRSDINNNNIIEMKSRNNKNNRRADLSIEWNEETFIKLDQIQSYVYLGTFITENGNETKEIEARLIKDRSRSIIKTCFERILDTDTGY